MAKKHRRYFIRSKEAKSLLSKASEKLKVDLEKTFNSKANIELVETDFAQILLINGEPLLFKTGENIFPTLVFNKLFVSMPKVVVDMGAVPHLCNGANVMAPGIVRFQGKISKGDMILVVDEKHGKPIAVGEVVCDVDYANKATQGVIVKNVHFVGDKIWAFIKKFSHNP